MDSKNNDSEDHDSRERILLVDDDRASLELAERILHKEGYSAISTDAPRSVLQLARTVRPAAIFVDILMPGFNGWDVLAMLKSDPVAKTIPVVMLSILEERKKALEHGADDFLAKPIEGRQLNAVLKTVREKRKDVPEARALAG